MKNSQVELVGPAGRIVVEEKDAPRFKSMGYKDAPKTVLPVKTDISTKDLPFQDDPGE